jgi:hypothetical protein
MPLTQSSLMRRLLPNRDGRTQSWYVRAFADDE